MSAPQTTQLEAFISLCKAFIELCAYTYVGLAVIEREWTSVVSAFWSLFISIHHEAERTLARDVYEYADLAKKHTRNFLTLIAPDHRGLYGRP